MKHLRLFLPLVLLLFFNDLSTFAQTGTNPQEAEMYRPDVTNRQVKEYDIDLPRRGRGRAKVEIVNNMVIYEGDILLGHEAKVSGQVSDGIAITNNNYRWEDGIIPYVIAAGHPRKNDILTAIAHIKQNTNLCMVERTTQRDYVKFISGSGCWSFVGKQTFEQPINIGNCSVGSIIHEICHAAGMYHEQSRSDRDQYIEVKWNNIKAGKSHNFNKKDSKGTDIGAYDFGSIMHYPSKAFSKNGQATIVSKVGPKAFGQRSGLSPFDIASLNSMYPNATGCGVGSTVNTGGSSSKTTTTTGGNTSTGGSSSKTTTTTGGSTSTGGSSSKTTTTTGGGTSTGGSSGKATTGGGTSTGGNSGKATTGGGTSTGGNSGKATTRGSTSTNSRGGTTTSNRRGTTTGSRGGATTSGRRNRPSTGGGTSTSTGGGTSTSTGGGTSTSTGGGTSTSTGGGTSTGTGGGASTGTGGGTSTSTGGGTSTGTGGGTSTGTGGGTSTSTGGGTSTGTGGGTSTSTGGGTSTSTGGGTSTGTGGGTSTGIGNPTGAPSHVKGKVAFYTESHFQGKFVLLTPGTHSVANLLKQLKSGKIESLSFGNELTVTLVLNTRRSKVLSSSVPNLSNFKQTVRAVIIKAK